MSTNTTTPAPPIPALRKSRRRWYLLGAFILLLFATPTAYYFISAWWSDRQFDELAREIDAEDPDWRWPDLVAQIKPPPDEQNSAVQIAKVRALLKKAPFAILPKWDSGATDPMLPRNARLAEDWAKPLRDSLGTVAPETMAEARKLKDMPVGCFAVKAEENPMAMNLDYVQGTREIMRLLQMDAVRRAQEKDMEGAAESCQAILNTAQALKDQPFLISLLVRIAGQAIAIGAIERTLAQGTVSEKNLQIMQSMLEAAASDDGLHHAMRGERAIGHQAYLNLRSGKMTFSQLLGGTNLNVGIHERLLDAFPGFILKDYPDFLRRMNEQVRVSKLKDAERAEAFEKLDQQVRQERNFLIRLIMPATMKVSQASQRSQAQLRSAITAIAAERYRVEHGAWPTGFDDLVKAKLLRDLPLDPYDGKPLRWKKTPTGILVYSVGLDKTDDGGNLDRSNPLTPGSDLGFELWHPKLRGIAPEEPK